jgi:Mrp family chromosome partitioning ATPase
MQAQLAPDVILYDLPPLLAGDDVTGFLPNLDCVLLVIGGGLTKPSEVTECERMLEDHCPLLGVVLNMDEGVSVKRYAYDQ